MILTLISKFSQPQVGCTHTLCLWFDIPLCLSLLPILSFRVAAYKKHLQFNNFNRKWQHKHWHRHLLHPRLRFRDKSWEEAHFNFHQERCHLLSKLLLLPLLRSVRSLHVCICVCVLSVLDIIYCLYQQGANRQLWFASAQSLSYLDGRWILIQKFSFSLFFSYRVKLDLQKKMLNDQQYYK